MSKVFTKSINAWPLRIVTILFVLVLAVIFGVWYYASPQYTRVGFAPNQPVAFDHALHAGQLGLDCRFCHSHVERSGHANVPSTTTCMSCHNQVRVGSPALEEVVRAYENGDSIPWVRVHQLPDFVYFNHAVHVNRGVSCYDCHGQVNEMRVVSQAKTHSMAFCLECHRAPEKRIRPPEEIFNLDWRPESVEEQLQRGMQVVHDWNVKPPVTCTGCHQ